jgi:hypothetical protein
MLVVADLRLLSAVEVSDHQGDLPNQPNSKFNLKKTKKKNSNRFLRNIILPFNPIQLFIQHKDQTGITKVSK